MLEMAVKDKVTVIVSLHEIELAAKIADYVMCVGGNGTIEFRKTGADFYGLRFMALNRNCCTLCRNVVIFRKFHVTP